ncbi:cytochrome P450 1 [Gymnopus androsaceus JB14]|uniref:Cytochrome P450 1 n=1 Tax=Gymnopus androsaceus JB14 TaxID=1447944 RepID=A0A6A4HEI2_9AGAR|nr:cytochrome P450 1 [Gymnopus androsaceus JB14]
MTYISAMPFASLIAALALVYFVLRRKRRPTLPYPPGPKVATMPTYDAWVEYRNWGREYGELVYIQDRNILILNTSRAAIDLLEKRARIYSDRRTTRMTKLCGGDINLAFVPYSDSWRRKRKLFQQTFRQSAINRFNGIQYNKVHEFLRGLIITPDKLMQHCMTLSQGIIFSALYGLDVDSEDPFAQEAVEFVEELLPTFVPGSFPIIEQFPWLRFMPSWLPGCGFKRIIDQCLRQRENAINIPFDMAVENLKTGKGTSIIAGLANKYEGNLAEIEIVKAMGTGSHLGATDTTVAAISSFILTMILHPNAQAKGQEEIDRVIGRDRLPTFDDRQSLPYVEAIYREVLRLHPPLPQGVEHTSIEDDFYHGYHIPKGCSVTPNIWAMNRDPDVYARPDDFLPERFLDTPTGPFTNIGDIHAFGFGRRVCVGRYMADNAVWLSIASVLATLNLTKPKDKEGNEIDISEEFSHCFARYPKPYQCTITPRAPYAEKLILATAS